MKLKKKSKTFIYDIAKVMNWLPKMRNLKLVMSFFSSDTSRMDKPFAAKKMSHVEYSCYKWRRLQGNQLI